MESQISELFKISMESLKNIVDVDTIVGQSIRLENGVSIIPVSRVKCGFATGGTDQGKGRPEVTSPFGGATGGTVSITPVAFLVIVGDEVRLMHLEDQSHLFEKLIDQFPGALEAVRDFFSRRPKVSTVEVVEKHNK
jgi:sporulation protein YtfJ